MPIATNIYDLNSYPCHTVLNTTTLIKLRIDRIPLYGVVTYFVSITGKGFITLQNKNKKHLANSLWH